VPGRLGDHVGEAETVGQFYAGERLQNQPELLGAATSRYGDRFEPLAAVGHAGGAASGFARANVVIPALLANSVGGVPAVGNEPDLLVHFVDALASDAAAVTDNSERYGSSWGLNAAVWKSTAA